MTRIVMVTGDRPEVAEAVGTVLGEDAMRGRRLLGKARRCQSRASGRRP